MIDEKRLNQAWTYANYSVYRPELTSLMDVFYVPSPEEERLIRAFSRVFQYLKDGHSKHKAFVLAGADMAFDYQKVERWMDRMFGSLVTSPASIDQALEPISGYCLAINTCEANDEKTDTEPAEVD